MSKKHPSETNNNFKNSYLKSIIFLVKNETFYKKIFCNQNNIGLKYFADIRFGMFQSNLIDKNIKFSEIKILQCIKNDVVVNFNDVIRIAHCAINIDLTRPVVILTFELTL